MLRLMKKRQPDDPANSGALNDLSFILIIFFIVIAGFNINKGFLMNLPDREKPRVVKTEELIVATLDAGGNLFMEGVAVSAEDLRRETERISREFPNCTFLLQIHPDSSYQSVISVIHDIRKLDVENFSFRMTGGSE